MNQKTDRIMKWLGSIAAVGFLFLLSLIMYWGLYPYNIVDIKEPIKIINREVEPGKYLYFEITYSKNSNIVGTRQIQLVNSMVIILNEPAISNLAVGENITYRSAIQIPRHIAPGYYYMVVTIQYHPNILRTVTESFKSQEFEIVDRKG